MAAVNAILERSRTSMRTAAALGSAVGLAAVLGYVLAGLLLAHWSTSEFLANGTVETIWYLVGMTALVVAVVAIPIVVFLRFDLVAPLVVLALVGPVWLTIGTLQGVLSLESSFGLALYAAVFSPVYLVLYGVLGVGEYLLRARGRGR